MGQLNFHIRNLTREVMSLLKKEAVKKRISVNSLILLMINNNLGISHQSKRNVHHDLDHLAGTWTKKDAKAFDERVSPFNQIDEDLWI